MKRFLLLVTVAFSLLALTAFGPGQSIDSVIGAMRSGNTNELSKHMDANLDLSLPGKTETYSKAQAVIILKDFFNRNGVTGFEIKHKGDNKGNEYCIGMLQTKSGAFRTTVYMKAAGGKQVIKEIRIQQ